MRQQGCRTKEEPDHEHDQAPVWICEQTRCAGAAAAIAFAMYAASQPHTTRLPAYVRMITSDAQVAAELELANACERIERAKGRMVVVECALPPLGAW